MGLRTYRGIRARAERVNVRSLLYILRGLNHNWNEVNNEMFFTSLRSYYQIDYSLVYVVNWVIVLSNVFTPTLKTLDF